MRGSALDRIPGAYDALGLVVGLYRRISLERAVLRPDGRARLALEEEGPAATPRDFRPADPDAGRRILAGGFLLAGDSLASGVRGDPWDQPAPSRPFAERLHAFEWLKDLTALGEAGAWEGLRLILAWRRLFSRWNAFSWSGPVLERRVFNLACGIPALRVLASDAEVEEITGDLARQAQHLLDVADGPAHAAERAVAAAVAGAVLGAGGAPILDRALRRLTRRLPRTVRPDGGHASRSPQAALELLFDLLTLHDALAQLGCATPDAMILAMERLAVAVRFFTLADGRLAASHGGETLSPSYVAAALATGAGSAGEARHDGPPAACNGYQRVQGRRLQMIVDAARPARGGWSLTACAQPLALELLADGRRLIVNSGWSAQSHAPQALRLADGASTLCVGEADCGAPLAGFAARNLGPRLRDSSEARPLLRHEGGSGLWIELEHEGWLRRFGFLHERRLYLDRETDELRGEDRLVCVVKAKEPEGRRFVPYAIRFHLAPHVSALIARDGKSVLIKADGEETGWQLRHDAAEAALEPSTQLQAGQVRHGEQIVLRGQTRLDTGVRVRWKLSAATGPGAASRVDVATVPA